MSWARCAPTVRILRLAIGGTTLLLAVLGAGLFMSDARAQEDATIGIIAIDADPTGNTATSLGPLNACKRVEPGSRVDVDVVVDAVPEERGILGTQFVVNYDFNLLTLVAVDGEFLMAAEGAFEPFEGMSDPLPDDDGSYTYIMVDLQSNAGGQGANIESGPGVLARLTFQAKAAGISEIALGFDPPDVYPAIIDIQNTTIGVDRIGAARLAMGRDCDIPPEATPVVQNLPPIQDLGLSTPPPTQPSDAAAASPTRAGGEGEGGTPGASPARSPAPGTPDGPGAGGPAATEGDSGDVASTGTIVLVAALAAVGAALAAGGGWMLYRRLSGGARPPG